MSAVKITFLTAILTLFATLFANHVNNTCYSNDPTILRSCLLPWLSPRPFPQDTPEKMFKKASIQAEIGQQIEPPQCLTASDRKTELELLQCLAKDSNNNIILYELKNRPLVQNAKRKTERWAVRDRNNLFDAETTLNYLIFLNKDTASPQSVFQSKHTVTIEMALGRNPDVLRHPLFEGKFITDGCDDLGIDWSKVPLEVMNALLWARMTNHPLFPKNMDGAKATEISEKAAERELTELVLKKIVRDHKIALDDKEMTAFLADVTRK